MKRYKGCELLSNFVSLFFDINRIVAKYRQSKNYKDISKAKNKVYINF